MPHQYRPRWNIDGAILDHFISPSVLSSRARNSVARIYPHQLPATCKHIETALSKKDRMRANKRRNIRSRSLLETRGEIDHAIVDFARSSKLTRRSPRIRRRTNSSLFLKLIEYSKLKFEWFSRRQCFVLNDWKMLTVSKQTPQSLSRPLSLVRVRLVFSFEPCLLISKRCVWLVHLARSHASLDSRVKIAEDRDDGDDEQDNE